MTDQSVVAQIRHHADMGINGVGADAVERNPRPLLRRFDMSLKIFFVLRVNPDPG